MLWRGPADEISRSDGAITEILMAAARSQPTSGLCQFPQRHDPEKTAPAYPAPLAGAVAFEVTVSRLKEQHMKLTIMTLAAILAVASSMALAQGAGGGGTSEAVAGAAGSSSVGSSTATGTAGSASTGSSIQSSGASTGAYPTLKTPGGFPSALPAPGVVIGR